MNTGVIVRVIPKLKLYDKDGIFVREWLPEDCNKLGKQFYNESYWTLEVTNDGYDHNWTFEITEADLK